MDQTADEQSVHAESQRCQEILVFVPWREVPPVVPVAMVCGLVLGTALCPYEPVAGCSGYCSEMTGTTSHSGCETPSLVRYSVLPSGP